MDDEKVSGAPLFSRLYRYADGQTLIVKIWAPVSTYGLFHCFYQIGDDIVRRAPGLDEIDAVYTTLQTIQMHLTTLKKTKDSSLRWDKADDEGDLALPAFYPDLE